MTEPSRSVSPAPGPASAQQTLHQRALNDPTAAARELPRDAASSSAPDFADDSDGQSQNDSKLDNDADAFQQDDPKNSNSANDSDSNMTADQAGGSQGALNGKSSFRRVKSRSARACEVYEIPSPPT